MHIMVRVSYLVLLFAIIKYYRCASVISSVDRNNVFELSVVHINDFHGRFDETTDSSGVCKPSIKCIGGFSRMYQQIISMKESNPDILLLNAGDTFAGTLWYTVGKWNITQEFINKLNFDVSVLGNHEFEDNLEGLVPYMKALNHPIVVANLDATDEPIMHGLFTKSTIVERNGKKIGVIGVLVSTTPTIANTSKLIFHPESPSINEEAERLVKEEGVFTNVILSHAGYDIDQQIAANASEKISLIVGGHTHTFLYTGDNPPGPDEVGGPYPTIVKSSYGHDILIVQASSYCRYVGNITVYLDGNGEVVDYSGAPIFLSHDSPQNETINDDLEPWREKVDAVPNPVLGSSLVTLNKWGCSHKECTMGNFYTDAMVFAYTQNASEGTWTNVSIALADAEGLRTSLEPGNITDDDLSTALPYKNTLDVGELEGRQLKELFEYNVIRENSGNIDVRMLQVSGLRVVLNISRPAGERVQSIKARCQNCTIPIYEEIQPDQSYKVIVESFIRNGGYNFSVIVNDLKNVVVGTIINSDASRNYLKNRSPIFEEEEGRITIF